MAKHQRRFAGFDDKIVSMYARGMTTREIERHLREIYGVEVGRDLISRVTDAVFEDVTEWQSRPLEALYPIIWMDALVVKIRDYGRVQNHHAYLAIGITDQGTKDVLGLWISRGEGAKHWMAILTELKNRGIDDVLICCVDGLKGFPDAIEAVCPETIVQTCIVHMIRNSLRFVCYKDHKAIVKDLRDIYAAPSDRGRRPRTRPLRRRMGQPLPQISQCWHDTWERIIPYFALPPGAAPRRLHHQPDRSLNSKSSASHPHPRPFPRRRRST